MIIYKSEANIPGLADKVLANRCISYTTQLNPWDVSNEDALRRQNLFEAARATFGVKSLASSFDSDLYPTKSILVTTNWNKNDDVFSLDETWAARHTPSHKPTNLEHNENVLVGHITETWAMDTDGNIIPDNSTIDELPNTYHLANGAVIYLNWEDEKLVERTEKLIAEIQSGNKFVSMEALFTNFGYAIITPENEFSVIARTKETAFLTQHLRVYGGEGKFDGCKIGRILKNITFCGKGYVDKPANEDSIIFNKGHEFNYTAASHKNPFKMETGVSLSCSSITFDNKKENSLMSDSQVDLFKDQATKLEAENKVLANRIEELTSAVSKANVDKLTAEIADLKNSLEATETDKNEAAAKVDELIKEGKEAAAKLQEVSDAKAELEKQVAEAKEAELRTNRISSLVSGGFEKSEAETKVDLFSGLTDEQFDAVAKEIIAAKFNFKSDDDEEEDKEKKNKKDSKASDDVTQDSADASVSEETLEEVELVDDINLNADASKDENELTELRTALARWMLQESVE